MKKTTTPKVPSPISERQNSTTSSIDTCSIPGKFRCFRSSDSQLFFGFKHHESLIDLKVINTIINISSNIRQCIINNNPKKENNNQIVLSGCGTSGRFSWICARNYNRYLKKELKRECVKYLISGGDKALIRTKEFAEDMPRLGERELKECVFGKGGKMENQPNMVVFVGITCGLSAPYVAGQINYAMNYSNNDNDNGKTKFVSVLQGFNPVELARKNKIPNWDKSFNDIVNQMMMKGTLNNDCYILNPIVGPESITGSTRMKGASATKILNDTMFFGSFFDDEKRRKEKVIETLYAFEETFQSTYQNINLIEDICKDCGNSLRKKGHIYYIGAGVSAIYGIIDASECNPTFGASLEDIRGFIVGGWKEMDNKNGEMEEISKQYEHLKISVAHFISNFIPKLTEFDTVIFLGIQFQDESILNPLLEVLEKVRSNNNCKNVYSIWISSKPTKSQTIITMKNQMQDNFKNFQIPRIELLKGMKSFGEFSLKLILNVISTTSFILLGTTFSNIMVNLRLSNHKLVLRAAGICEKLLGIDKKVALDKLLHVIYEGESYQNKTIKDHVIAASKKSSVVPITILLLTGKCKTIEEAKKELEKEPIVRNVIKELLHK